MKSDLRSGGKIVRSQIGGEFAHGTAIVGFGTLWKRIKHCLISKKLGEKKNWDVRSQENARKNICEMNDLKKNDVCPI